MKVENGQIVAESELESNILLQLMWQSVPKSALVKGERRDIDVYQADSDGVRICVDGYGHVTGTVKLHPVDANRCFVIEVTFDVPHDYRNGELIFKGDRSPQHDEIAKQLTSQWPFSEL